MAIVSTNLVITPTFVNKQVKAVGAIAVNERVAVTVLGVVDNTDPETPVVPSGLLLRLTSQSGMTEYARFPLDIGETWTISGDDVTCTLLLNREPLQNEFLYKCANATLEAKLFLESGTTDNLYADGRILVRNWVQNPVDPVAGSAQIQGQIDVITGRLEDHQHDATVEGESSFPHNNLSGRDVVGVHPAIESGVASAIAKADQAIANADIAILNTEEPIAMVDLIHAGDELGGVDSNSNLAAVKLLLNDVVEKLNEWRNS